jgi:hypothetical protein
MSIMKAINRRTRSLSFCVELPRLDPRRAIMKRMMRKLTGALFITAAALGTALPQSAPREQNLSDIKARWPPETIYASALCQRVLDDPGTATGHPGQVIQFPKPDPKTFVPDLHSLMEKSDEVILAAPTHDAVVPSPSGKSVATYTEVKIVRSWKGAHHAGDTLVFGMPFGNLPCEPPRGGMISTSGLSVFGPSLYGSNVYVLFLRRAKGDETKLVQGLFPAAGEGAQGIFALPVPNMASTDIPPGSKMEDYCGGNVNVEHCDAFVQTSQKPVDVYPVAGDPLVKKYNGMPAADFLREVQSVAVGQAGADKSSLR